VLSVLSRANNGPEIVFVPLLLTAGGGDGAGLVFLHNIKNNNVLPLLAYVRKYLVYVPFLLDLY
jgi:hypothetical protein